MMWELLRDPELGLLETGVAGNVDGGTKLYAFSCHICNAFGKGAEFRKNLERVETMNNVLSFLSLTMYLKYLLPRIEDPDLFNYRSRG